MEIPPGKNVLSPIRTLNEDQKKELAWAGIASAKNKLERVVCNTIAGNESPDLGYLVDYAKVLVTQGRVSEAKELAVRVGSLVGSVEKQTDKHKRWEAESIHARLSSLERNLGMEKEADKHLAFTKSVIADPANYPLTLNSGGMDICLSLVKADKIDDVFAVLNGFAKYSRTDWLIQISQQLLQRGDIEKARLFFNKINPAENSTKIERAELGLELIATYRKTGAMDEAKKIVKLCEEKWDKLHWEDNVIPPLQVDCSQDAIHLQTYLAEMYFLVGNRKMVSVKNNIVQKMVESREKGIYDGGDYQFVNVLADRVKLLTQSADNQEVRVALQKHAAGSYKDNDLSKRVINSTFLIAGDYNNAKEPILRSDDLTWVSTVRRLQSIGHDMSGAVKMVEGLEVSQMYKHASRPGFAQNDFYQLCDWMVENGHIGWVSNLISTISQGNNIIPLRTYQLISDLSVTHRKSNPINIELFRPLLEKGGDIRWLVDELTMALTPQEKEKLLAMVPEQDRDRTVDFMNLKMAHETPLSEAERKPIFDRTKTKILAALTKNPDKVNREEVKLATQTMYELKDKEAKDFIFGLVRDGDVKNSMYLRLVKTMAEMNTIRGNNFLWELFNDERMGKHESLYLLNKLTENKYLNDDVLKWVKTKNDVDALEVLRILAKNGIVPSQDILTWVSNGVGEDLVTVVHKRLDSIHTFETEFRSAQNAQELRTLLAQDKDKAMIYYILENGKTHFDLINNYSFEKFYDLITLIDQLKVHEAPLAQFDAGLGKAGFTDGERESILTHLREGKHPFWSASNPHMETTVRLDVSNATKFEAANKEVGLVFGSRQIGACLKSPYYRQLLAQIPQPRAQALLSQLKSVSDLPGSASVISDIEREYPEVLSKTLANLRPKWGELDRKMDFGGLSIDQLLSQPENRVDAVAVIGTIEARREELKMAKRELISVLKRPNPQATTLKNEIDRKKRAAAALHVGLGKKPELQTQIDLIWGDIDDLEQKIKTIGLSPLALRFTGLTKEEREKILFEEGQELTALNEKNPANILMYQIMQLCGEENLIENDGSVIREVASHLVGPMEIVRDLAQLDVKGKQQKETRQVKVRMMDKKDDLMSMVRFADSKICCFSSSNYSMQVAHNTENKQWVASINKDPLSFVFEIVDEEIPGIKKNLGFVFGMYGISEEGHPEVFLNGIYYSGGNDASAVTNIASSIEEMLSVPLRAHHQLMASVNGGAIGGALEGYSNEKVRAMRLRAIDDERGKPETHIYDDLGKEINEWVEYEYSEKRNVMHKTLKEVPRDTVEEVIEEEIQKTPPMLQQAPQTAIARVKNRLRSLFTP